MGKIVSVKRSTLTKLIEKHKDNPNALCSRIISENTELDRAAFKKFTDEYAKYVYNRRGGSRFSAETYLGYCMGCNVIKNNE